MYFKTISTEETTNLFLKILCKSINSIPYLVMNRISIKLPLFDIRTNEMLNVTLSQKSSVIFFVIY